MSAYHPSHGFVVVARLIDGPQSGDPRTIPLPRFGGSVSSLALGIVLLAALGAGWASREMVRQSLPRLVSTVTRVSAACVAYAVWQLLLRAATPLL